MTFALVSCSSPVVPASTPTTGAVKLKLYATTGTLPLANDLSARYNALHPSVTFETIGGNYQSMLEAMMNEKNAFLLTSYLSPESTLFAWPLGQDGIAVIVNPDNQIEGLSIGQLRSIYLGLVGDWSDLGGSEGEIVVLSREGGSGTRAEFERQVMGARLTTQSAQIAPSSAAMISSVANTVGAIGYVSMGHLNSSVKTVLIDGALPTAQTVYENTYALRATLMIVGRAQPRDEYLSFIGWMQSQEGQCIIGTRYAPLLHP
jgi:phosphate transport system substrate-binding protein